MAQDGLRCGLLGAVWARYGDTLVPLRKGKPTAILAILLLRKGKPASVDELAALLWPGNAPRTYRVTIANYVKLLREAFRPVGAGDVVLTGDQGYYIPSDGLWLDLTEFEKLCSKGRTAARTGDWAAAADSLSRAGDLWLGAPLANVRCPALTDAEVPILEEARRTAQEDRISADLHLGRERDVLPELRRLVAAEPLRELPQELLMRALAQDGQRDEALRVYQRARRVIVDETGFEPGPGMQEAHRLILGGPSASNSASRASVPGSASPRAVAARVPSPRTNRTRIRLP